MTGKILRRCTICKKYSASYLVEDPQHGKYYLCYSCWRATQTPPSVNASAEDGKPEGEVEEPREKD